METVETFKETMRKVIAASSLDAAIQKTNLLENSSTQYKNPRTSQPYINQLDQAQDKLSSTEGKKIAKIHPEKAQPSPSNIGKPETSHWKKASGTKFQENQKNAAQQKTMLSSSEPKPRDPTKKTTPIRRIYHQDLDTKLPQFHRVW